MPPVRGKVYLVGAGPGHPGLLTQRGAEVLSRCRVVVYDQQIEAVIRPHLQPDAELIRVTINEPGASDEANRLTHLVVDQAKRGQVVGRVTLGDPFLFGRAGGEVLLCREHGIPIEVVPGVSLALSGPAFAGIPVLQPGVARTALVCAGPYSEPKLVGVAAEAAPPAPPPKAVAPPPPLPPAPKKPGVNIVRRKKDGPAPPPTVVTAPPPATKVLPAVVPGRNPDYWSPDDTFYSAEMKPAQEAPQPAAAPVAVPQMVTDEEGRDWRALSKADTIVFMNLNNALEHIREALLMAGRAAADPCAYIISPGTTRQTTIATTLGELTRESMPRRPREVAILVVGDVVNLRETLNFHEERPLFGERIVRLETGSIAEVEELEELGAHVRTLPMVQPQPISGLSVIIDSLRDDLRLATYLIFADCLGAEYFFRGLRDARIDMRLLSERCEIVALNVETRDLLTNLNLTSTLLEGGFSASRVLDYLDNNLKMERLLLIGPCGMGPELCREFRQRGGAATELPVYDTMPVLENIQRLRDDLGRGDVSVLSARQAQSLVLLAENWGQETFTSLMEHVVVAAFGRHACKKGEELALGALLKSVGSDTKSLASLLLERPRQEAALAAVGGQSKNLGSDGRSTDAESPSSSSMIDLT